MRKILDSLFKNKKLSFIIPISIAIVAYLLFVLFGTAEDKRDLMITTPIVSVIWFFGLFLGVFILVKNPKCPEWFLNLLELFLVVTFSLYAVADVMSFAASGFRDFDIGICLDFITYSAISWAHSKRTK